MVHFLDIIHAALILITGHPLEVRVLLDKLRINATNVNAHRQKCKHQNSTNYGRRDDSLLLVLGCREVNLHDLRQCRIWHDISYIGVSVVRVHLWLKDWQRRRWRINGYWQLCRNSVAHESQVNIAVVCNRLRLVHGRVAIIHATKTNLVSGVGVHHDSGHSVVSRRRLLVD